MREPTEGEPEPYAVRRPDPSLDSTSPTLHERLVTRFPSLDFALKDLDGRTLWILFMAALLLVVFRKFGGSGFFEGRLRPEALRHHTYLSVYGDFYWFSASFFILGIAPLLLSWPRRLRPRRLGLGLGDWRFGLRWTGILLAVMIPLVAWVSRWPAFWRYYPINDVLATQVTRWAAGLPGVPESFPSHFVAYELLYAVYFLGWEFFFRGYLTFGLHDRLGIHGVFAANIPFALLHIGKPLPEVLGSIVAGVALGIFALRARSFWYCFIVHALVAWSMDAWAILRRVQNLTDS